MIAWLSRLIGPQRAVPFLVLFGIFLMLLVCVLVLRSCAPEDQTAQVDHSIAVADAYADAAENAVETVVKSADREKSVDVVVNEATKEIHNAPDAAAARAAVVRATCQLRAYRDQPTCSALRNANP